MMDGTLHIGVVSKITMFLFKIEYKLELRGVAWTAMGKVA